eukprot:gene1631-33021_t
MSGPGGLDLELDQDEAMFLEGMLHDSTFGEDEEEDSYSNNYTGHNNGFADHSWRSEPTPGHEQDTGTGPSLYDTPAAAGGAAQYEYQSTHGPDDESIISYQSSSGQNVDLPSPYSSSPRQQASRSSKSATTKSSSACVSPHRPGLPAMDDPPLPTVSESEPSQPGSPPTRMDAYRSARESMSTHWQYESICKQYNESAMQFLESGKHVTAHELLTKALSMFENGGALVSDPLDHKTEPISADSAAMIKEHRQRLHSLTLNNLGCYYKQRGKLEAALMYLMQVSSHNSPVPQVSSHNSPVPQAHILEEKRQDAPQIVVPPGGGLYPGKKVPTLVGPTSADLTATQLNLCAVLSGMGRHEQALGHAEAATGVLCEASGLDEAELAAFAQRFVSAYSAGARAGGLAPCVLESVAVTVSHQLDAMQRSNASEASTLPIAYFNRAVELEHLEMWPEALSAFSIATAVAVRLQGRASALAMTCTKSLQSFRLKMKQVDRRRLVSTTTFSGQPSSCCSAPSSTRPSGSGDRLGRPSNGSGLGTRDSRVPSGNYSIGSSSTRAASCRGPRASSPMGSRNQPSASMQIRGSPQRAPRRLGTAQSKASDPGMPAGGPASSRSSLSSAQSKSSGVSAGRAASSRSSLGGSVGAPSSHTSAAGSAHSHQAPYPRRGSSASSGPPGQGSQQLLPPLFTATAAKAHATHR